MRELYEKIALHGATSLTDSELLGIIIDSQSIAENILEQCTLKRLPIEEVSRLRMSAGMGLAKAAKIAASVELARRIAKNKTDVVDRIQSLEAAVKLLRPIFDGLDHEECWAVYLTNSGRVLDKMRISQGGVRATTVDNKIIIKRAIELLATQIIIAHNHPSDCPEPSHADISMTYSIRSAAEMFDIILLDHIILTQTDSYSFKKFGLLDR